jgi:hypothetical protein
MKWMVVVQLDDSLGMRRTKERKKKRERREEKKMKQKHQEIEEVEDDKEKRSGGQTWERIRKDRNY